MVGGYEKGVWTIAADLAIGTPTLINNWTPYAGATNLGITVNAGVFTVGVGGEYLIALSMRFSSATADRYCFIAGSGTTQTWAKSSTPLSATGLNVSCAVPIPIAAGGQFRCYGYSGSASNATHEAGGDLITGVSVYRLGN